MESIRIGFGFGKRAVVGAGVGAVLRLAFVESPFPAARR